MRAPYTGVLSRQGQAPIPAAVQWLPGGGSGGWNSSFGGAGGFFDAPPGRTAADTQDCLFDIPNLQSVPATGFYVIPPGQGYAVMGATTQLEAQVGAVGTWVTIGAAASTVFYVSDGYNIRLHNTSAGAVSSTLYPLR